MAKTVVLGGGLSGLAAGYYMLRHLAQPVTIYESSPRLGGWIRTERHKDKGFQFEIGPRTIRPKGLPGANTLELIDELNLSIQPIPSSHIAARNRMIYAKGQLCLLPSSPMGILKVLPPFTLPLYSALLNDLTEGKTKIKSGDESIYSFVKRRFGSELADYAISPMICGICAGDAKEISVRFLLDELFDKEQKWGGVVKGLFMEKISKKKISKQGGGLFADVFPPLYEKARKEKWAMYGVEKGLEHLPRELGNYLRKQQVNIQLSNECRELIFTRDGVRLILRDGETNSEHIISAIPPFKLAQCIKNQHPCLAAQLLDIQYVDVAVVNLQYNTKHLLDVDGFGLLVPPVEKLPILGVIFDSCCFTMDDNTVLTVMMGGKWFEEYFGQRPSQKQLLDVALQHIKLILGVQQQPKFSRVNILHKCIPQYTVGHKRRIEDIRNYLISHKLPISVCGAAYDGVGINDVILSARRQVQNLRRDETSTKTH